MFTALPQTEVTDDWSLNASPCRHGGKAWRAMWERGRMAGSPVDAHTPPTMTSLTDLWKGNCGSDGKLSV